MAIHFTPKVLVRAVVGTLSFGVVAAVAQTPAPAPAPSAKIERVEVTGSNIKRVDTESAAPITIITREEIQRSGKTTVTELLRTLPINSTGGLNDITSANSFSSGASSVSLRGLGSGATLVLLNGRRVAPFAPADPNFGQSAVVNLDSFPLDVIDRVEILKDGASAIYGSEAIAGVVNLILRKDFTGAQIGGSMSINRDSEYQIRRATTTLGIGDLARDRYNVFFNYERYERDVVKFMDVENYLNRDILRNSGYATGRRFSSSYAGAYLRGVFNPATLAGATATAFFPAAQQPANCVPGAVKDAGGICRWDLIQNQDIVPKSDRDNFYARGNIDFSANLSGYAEFGFNRYKTQFRGNPQVWGDFGSWYSSNLQRLVTAPEVLPVGHPNNPFTTPVIYRHRFVEVGNADRIADAEATRFVVGLKGNHFNWDWEAGYLRTENENVSTVKNQIRASVLTRGILTGTYNFLNPGAGSITPSQLRIDTVDTAESSFSIFDVKGSRELFQLAGGPLGIAVGLEHRKEERVASPDAAKLAGEVVGFGAAFAVGKRDVTSLYAEVSAPIVKNLEMQLAFRTDKYSDYGRSTTPKIGAKWNVTPKLALRGSYAEGFRAPSLTEISRSSVSAFTTVTDPRRCINGDELDCARSIAILLESNAALKPEEAKTYNLGVVFEPIKDASISVDYFDIRRRNEVNILDVDSILANEGIATGVFANRVIRGTPTGDGLPGPIQAISAPFINGGKTEVSGIDIDARYDLNLGEYGKLTNRAFATWFRHFKSSAGEDEPLINYEGYRIPMLRASLGTSWEYRAWTFGLTGNYTRSYYVSSDPRTPCRTASLLGPQGICVVSGNATADASVSWRGIKNLTITGVARNIFDKRPPLDPLARPVNFTFHPFQSVYFTLGATYKFW
jgi:iron complex outermembrane recepter protein